MYKDGLLKDSDIYANIADIIDGTKPGRENDDEICYFNSIGLSFVDVSVAYSFYKKVLNSNLGKRLEDSGNRCYRCIVKEYLIVEHSCNSLKAPIE